MRNFFYDLRCYLRHCQRRHCFWGHYPSYALVLCAFVVINGGNGDPYWNLLAMVVTATITTAATAATTTTTATIATTAAGVDFGRNQKAVSLAMEDGRSTKSTTVRSLDNTDD